jgi:hypothetical protein
MTNTPLLLEWTTHKLFLGGKELMSEEEPTDVDPHKQINVKHPITANAGHAVGFQFVKRSANNIMVINDDTVGKRDVFKNNCLETCTANVEIMVHSYDGQTSMGVLYYDPQRESLIAGAPTHLDRVFTIHVDLRQQKFLKLNGSEYLYVDSNDGNKVKVTDKPIEHPLWPHAFFFDYKQQGTTPEIDHRIPPPLLGPDQQQLHRARGTWRELMGDPLLFFFIAGFVILAVIAIVVLFMYFSNNTDF